MHYELWVFDDIDEQKVYFKTLALQKLLESAAALSDAAKKP